MYISEEVIIKYISYSLSLFILTAKKDYGLKGSTILVLEI